MMDPPQLASALPTRRGHTAPLAVWCVLLTVLSTTTAPASAVLAARIVVEGQALDNTGGGVHGAKVKVFAPGNGAKPKLLASGETDETGDFKLELPDGVKGKITVRVLAENFQPFTETVDLAEDDEPFVVAELAGSLALSGRVTRAKSGKPVPGAIVTFETDSTRRATKTDRGGRYTIPGLQRGSGVVHVVADGFARERVDVDVQQAEAVDVALRPELDVVVIVVDDVKRPTAGVTVEAISEEPRRSYMAVTDRSGRAPLRGVHPDAAELRVRLSTDVHITTSTWDRSVRLPAGEQRVEQRFVLPRPATLVGRVVRVRGGKPVPLAHVSIGPDKASFVTSTNADRDGRFEVRGLMPGQVVVTAQHAEHAPELKVVRLDPNQTRRIELSLPPGATLVGVVKDADGSPVAKADVLAGEWRDCDTLALHAQTDAKGEFLLEHVPVDGLSLRVVARGYEPLMTEVLKPVRKRHELALSGQPDAPAPVARAPASSQRVLSLLANAETLDGKPLGADRLAGKFVFLDFWATWCPPCRGEVPHVRAANQALAKRGDLVIIGVSLDEDTEALKRFVKAQQMTWPQLFGRSGSAGELAKAFGVQAIPATFLIAPDGRIIAKDLRGPGLAKTLESLLNSPPAPAPRVNRPEF